ncbi:MAG TPA: ComF family protein [Burkholderiales bacterium]|nr:ComF family protein [Burkholderiales bacterium]
MLASLARRFANLAFGGTCYLCRGAAEGVLCAACDAELPRLEGAACPRCALPSPGGAVCGRCLAHPPAYDATVAALAYEFPADVLVQGLKFRGELALAPLLGQMLAARLPRGTRVDYILPVPLARARLRERGFNQALEIARPLAVATGCKLAPHLAERSRDTPPQLDLPLEERARNVRGAFRCAQVPARAEIALVDDVMTTGATLDELAATLKRAGAARVVNWVVARTPPRAHA